MEYALLQVSGHMNEIKNKPFLLSSATYATNQKKLCNLLTMTTFNFMNFSNIKISKQL